MKIEEVWVGIKTVGLFGYLYLIGLIASLVSNGEIGLIFVSMFCLCGVLFSYIYIKYTSKIRINGISLIVSVFPWIVLSAVVLFRVHEHCTFPGK